MSDATRRGERRRFRRDVAGLKPLSELPELEIARGHTDVRGWIVAASDGHPIGTVRELLAAPDTMSVRHLVVELGPEGTLPGDGRLVVIPLATVEPDPALDLLVATSVDPDDVESLPDYDREALDIDDEAGLLRRIGVRAMMETVAARQPDDAADAAASPNDSTREEPPRSEP